MKAYIRNKLDPPAPLLRAQELVPSIQGMKVICCHNITFLKAMRPIAKTAIYV